MNICLNGDVREIPDSITVVSQLFTYLGIQTTGRMLILNGEIYTKEAEYSVLKLSSDDAVEILQFVGGG